MLERQKVLLQHIVENNLKKEVLHTKMRIHSDFGRLLVMTENRLSNREESSDDSDIFEAWDHVISDMENASERKELAAASPQTELLKMAEMIGCKVEFTGEQPKERRALLLLYAHGNGSRAGNDNSITISDVTSQSLGVITIDTASNREVNTIIIPHNSKIPTKRSVQVHTRVDNQTAILVQVTEGDVEDVQFVNIIGRSTLSIPPYKRNSPVEIIYAYDPDQTISIEVIDLVTNKSLGTFEIDRVSNMTQAEVTKAIEVARHANIE